MRIQQDREVRERIAIDKQQIRQVALLDLAHLLAAVDHHRRAAIGRRATQRLGARVAVILDEEIEIARIAAIRTPLETVVAADQMTEERKRTRLNSSH